MTRWAIQASQAVDSGSQIIGNSLGPDLVSTATPLYLLQNHAAMPSYLDLFLGVKGGCIGEVSILALCIGIIYLVIRKVITLWLPVTYVATVAILTALAGENPLYHILSGGLFLGAFFMATDYVTSPLTRKAKSCLAWAAASSLR